MSSRTRRTSPSRRSRSSSRDLDDDDYNHRMNFPPNIEGMTSLKVDNITQRTGVNLLKKVFSKFGDLGDVYVPRYPDTFASRGFAFVRFVRKRDAEEAMRKMNGYVLDGRTLSIQMARYARPSPSRQVSSGPRRGPPSYSRGSYGGNGRFMSRNGHSSFRGRGSGGFRQVYRRSPFRKRSFSRSKSRSRSRDRKHRSSRRHRSRSRSRDKKDKNSKKRNEKDKRRSKSLEKDKDEDDKNDSMEISENLEIKDVVTAILEEN